MVGEQVGSVDGWHTFLCCLQSEVLSQSVVQSETLSGVSAAKQQLVASANVPVTAEAPSSILRRSLSCDSWIACSLSAHSRCTARCSLIAAVCTPPRCKLSPKGVYQGKWCSGLLSRGRPQALSGAAQAATEPRDVAGSCTAPAAHTNPQYVLLLCPKLLLY